MNPAPNEPDNNLGPEHFLFQNFGFRPTTTEVPTTTVLTPPTNSSTATPQPTINSTQSSSSHTSSSTLDLDELIRASSFNIGGQQSVNSKQFNVDDYAPRPYQKPKAVPPPPRKGLAKIWPFRRRRRKARYSEGVIYYQISYLVVVVAVFVLVFVNYPSHVEDKNLYQQMAHNGIFTQATVIETTVEFKVLLPFIQAKYLKYSYTVGGYSYTHESLVDDNTFNSAAPGANITILYAPSKPTVAEIAADPANDFDDANDQVTRDWVVMIGSFLAILWLLVDIGRNIHSKIKR